MRKIAIVALILLAGVVLLWMTSDNGPEGEQCNTEGALMVDGQYGTFTCRTNWYGDMQWHSN
jgi:hypothetical protein